MSDVYIGRTLMVLLILKLERVWYIAVLLLGKIDMECHVESL